MRSCPQCLASCDSSHRFCPSCGFPVGEVARNDEDKLIGTTLPGGYVIHELIGIGGMGMGNLALLMLAKGYQVSGSDVKESELTKQLRERGARIFIGHHIKNLEGADCVVYSSAISAMNLRGLAPLP